MNTQQILDQLETESRAEYLELEKALALASTLGKHRTHAKQLKNTKIKPTLSSLNSMVLIMGKTFNIYEGLKANGFVFDYPNKVNFKKASYEEYLHYAKEFEANPEIGVGYATSFEEAMYVLNTFQFYLQQTTKERAVVSDAQPYLEHELTGKNLEISKWLAEMIQSEKSLKFAFCNFKVIGVRRETAKAYLMDIEFSSLIGNRCGCCARELSNDISVLTGIGPICAEKLGIIRDISESNVEMIKEKFAEVLREVGVLKNVWIAKSQIKSII